MATDPQTSPDISNRKVLKVFSAASFLNDLGSDMLQPVWPFFVTQVIGASTGFLGFLDGLGDTMVALSQFVSGYISDRIRRKKIFIWLGYSLSALGRLGYLFSTSHGMLTVSHAFNRMGKMRDAPRDAYLAASMPEHRGRAFGILRTFDNLGSIIGVIATIILVHYLGIRTIIALAVIPSIIAALLIVFFIRREKDHIKIFKGITIRDLDRNTLIFLTSIGLLTFSTFSFSFLLLASHQLGFTTVTVPLLFLLFSVVASAGSIPFGKLSDSIGRKPVLMLSYGFWISAAIGFIFLRAPIAIAGLFVLYGLFKGAYEPVFKTFVSELAPQEFRSSVFGLFQMIIGLIALPASVTAGLLWQRFNFQAPFILSAVIATTSLIVLVFVKEKSKR